MKPVVERALHALDAGKAVRIAEQELSCVPLEPPRAPSAEAPTDERAIVHWREAHMQYQSKLAAWQEARAAAEHKLEVACQAYAQAQARLVANAFEGNGT